MDIRETYHGYEVRFQYHPDLVNRVKEIPGREYNAAEKSWFIPKASYQHLCNWAASLGIRMGEMTQERSLNMPEALPELTVDIPLRREMFKYQKQGVAYNLIHKRVIVGDQPGLGKTVQSIASVLAQDAFPCLVISPSTVKENWVREWKMWTDKRAMVLTDRVKTSFPLFWETGMVDIFIVNYESLRKYFIRAINAEKGKSFSVKDIVFRDSIKIFKSVIVDEAHRCRNEDTITCKATIGITNGKQIIYALTGTPLVNKPADLRPQLRIIQQLDAFGGYKGFMQRYCAGAREASNLQELNYILRKTCFYQRKKSEVLKDLPDKIRSIIDVDITNMASYRKEEVGFEEFLDQNTDADGNLEAKQTGAAQFLIQKLKHLAAIGKIDAVVEYAQEVIGSGEKIVIVGHHKDVIHAILDRIPGSVTVVGDDTAEQKQRNIDGFQTRKDVPAIILSKSGEVGITLTAASRVAFIEFPWTAASSDQFEDRCHRIGQKDSVQATYFQGIGTVDSYCYSIIEKKRTLGEQVTGNKDDTETDMVKDIVQLFRNRKKVSDGNGDTSGQI